MSNIVMSEESFSPFRIYVGVSSILLFLNHLKCDKIMESIALSTFLLFLQSCFMNFSLPK